MTITETSIIDDVSSPDVPRRPPQGPAVGRVRGTLLVVVLLALIAAPWTVAGPYAIATASRVLAFAVLVMSVQLLTKAGLIALGQAAYLGVGGYAAALTAIHVTQSGPVQLVVAAATAAGFAALSGAVAVRARGSIFILITIAVGQLTYTAAVQWRQITGGTDGLPGIPPVVPFPGAAPLILDGWIYYWVLGVTVLVLIALTRVVASPFGLALRSIAQNEKRARATGYPVTRYVLTAYTLAGAVAGIAGALVVASQQFMAPDQIGFDLSVLALLAVLVGGDRSMVGAAAGAAVVLLTRDYLGGLVPGHAPLLLGVLFVAAVYLMPNGLTGLSDTVRAGLLRQLQIRSSRSHTTVHRQKGSS